MGAVTEPEFDGWSWHDCHLWGLSFRVGDPDEDDWTADLVLDIDVIVEWICGVSGGHQFRVAPATLVFHGVTDPQIRIDAGDSGHRTAIHLASIDHIERAPVADQKVFLDRPYYRWRILLNWPQGSELAFGAAGFTQTLLADPVLKEVQHLSLTERSRLMSGQAGSRGAG